MSAHCREARINPNAERERGGRSRCRPPMGLHVAAPSAVGRCRTAPRISSVRGRSQRAVRHMPSGGSRISSFTSRSGEAVHVLALRDSRRRSGYCYCYCYWLQCGPLKYLRHPPDSWRRNAKPSDRTRNHAARSPENSMNDGFWPATCAVFNSRRLPPRTPGESWGFRRLWGSGPCAMLLRGKAKGISSGSDDLEPLRDRGVHNRLPCYSTARGRLTRTLFGVATTKHPTQLRASASENHATK